MRERATLIYQLINHKAYLYACGVVSHIAGEVNEELVRSISSGAGNSLVDVKEVVKEMQILCQY